MNGRQAREFRTHWQAVRAIEIEEQKAASITLRFRQMNAVFKMGIGLGLLRTEDDAEIEAVRRRWVRLKEMHDEAV
jgi:hypothetical protein